MIMTDFFGDCDCLTGTLGMGTMPRACAVGKGLLRKLEVLELMTLYDAFPILPSVGRQSVTFFLYAV